MRPTLCVVDDLQTDESARSDEQIKKRLNNIFKAILNLPGPGEEITVFCPCTVIERGAADQLLDRKLHPEWKGERIKANLLNVFLTIWSFGRPIPKCEARNSKKTGTEAGGDRRGRGGLLAGTIREKRGFRAAILYE